MDERRYSDQHSVAAVVLVVVTATEMLETLEDHE
jgi:hypothetical protein